ncbi:hypothetical protein D0Z07_3076 [Hyphodiscus hymeniophilus]|uniref:Uncharacterized protein n=1 Tax=Hyphodiscus hymeniophilus TaxID=353542 RepID=A0A9P6VM32_9HELO|nr:hypothetical protein D0Z07_3076 [Hyphodiscus hymeniophilus]
MADTHNRAPWRKAILIPFWCLQIGFMLVFIPLLVVSYKNNNDEDWDGTSTRYDVWITLCGFCLLLTITEIILLARHKLRPLAFLLMNVAKAAIWTALFILDIVSVVNDGGRTTSTVGIILHAVLLLCFWIPLIYGSIIYHRLRKEKKSYTPVNHPYSLQADTQDHHSSQIPVAYNTSATSHGPLRDIESNREHPGVDVQRARSPSFNHERDTRYETYMRTRMSFQQADTATSETFKRKALVSGGEGIPSVFVEHHDGVAFEMESGKSLSHERYL